MSESNRKNALKTIYSQLTTMKPSTEALAAIGININNSNGSLKTATEILDAVAVKFRTLSEEEKQNTAISIAGKSQLLNFLALVNNRGIAHDAATQAMNSEGSAMRENAQYMESFEARINNLKTAWQTFSLAIGEAILNDSIIAILNSLTSLAGVLSTVVKSVGLLPVVFGVVAAAASLLSKNFRTTLISVVTLGKGMEVLGVSTKSAGAALKGLAASTGIGLAFVAIGFALEALIGQWSDYTEKVREAKEAQETGIKSLETDEKGFNEKIKKYEELSTKVNLTAAEQTELLKVQNELAALAPSLVVGIDKEGQAHLKNIDTLKAEIEHLKTLQELKDRDRIESKEKNTDEAFDKIEENEKRLRQIESSFEINKVMRNFRRPDKVFTKPSEEEERAELLRHDINIENQNYAIKQSYQELADTMLENTASTLRQKDAYDQLTTADKNYLNALASSNAERIKNIEGVDNQKAAFYEFGNSLDETGTKIAGIRETLGAAGENFSTEEILNFTPEQINLINEVSKLTSEGSINWDNYKQRIEAAGLSVDHFNKIYVSFLRMFGKGIDETNEDSISPLDDNLTKYEKNLKSLDKKYKETSSIVSGLNKLLEENSEKKKVNAEDVKNLIDADGSLIEIFRMENGEIVLNTDKIKKKKNDYINAYDEMITKAVEHLHESNSSTLQKITNIQTEIKSVADLEEAYRKVSEFYDKAIRDASPFGPSLEGVRLNTEKNEALLFLDKLRELAKKQELHKTTLEGAGKSGGTKDKDRDKDNKEIKETITLLTELQKKLRDLEDQTRSITNERYKLKRGSEEYLKSLAEENKLIGEQIKLLEQGINDPSQLVSRQQTTTSIVPAGSTSTTTTTTPSPTSNSSSGATNGLDSLFTAATNLSKKNAFKYKRNDGDFQGNFKEFIAQAESDCSQFVQEMFKEFLTMKLPRTAALQAEYGSKNGTEVKKGDLKAGDLVFFETETNKKYSHVGIYKGDGKFMHMGNSGLKEANINSNYWASKYTGARRIINDTNKTYSGDNTYLVPSNTGKGTTTKVETAPITAEQEYEAQKSGLGKKNELEQAAYKNNIETINAQIYTSQQNMSKLDGAIFLSEHNQSLEKETSDKWKEYSLQQFDFYNQQQKELHEQNNMIKREAEKLGLTNGEFDDSLAENSKKWYEIQAKKIKTQEAYLGNIQKNIIDKYASQRDRAQRNLSLIGEVNTEEDKKKVVKAKQDILKTYEDELKDLYKEIEKLRNIVNNTGLSIEVRTAAKLLLDPLEKMANEINVSVKGSAQDLGKETAEEVTFAFNKTIEQIKFDISLLGDSEEDKKKAEALTKELFNVYVNGQEKINKSIAEINRKLDTETDETNRKKLLSMKYYLTEFNKSFMLEQANIQHQETRNRNNEADKIIENYKKMLNKKRELELKALQKTQEMADKAHRNTIKNLDNELKAYESVITAQLKAIDLQDEKDTYEKDRDNKQDEKDEIQRKISELSLDDSIEAKAKREILEKDLANKIEEIENLDYQRQKTLKKQKLNDDLEEKRRIIENTKETVNKQHEIQQEGFEILRDAINTQYDDLLEDEKTFYDLKQNLLSEDTKIVKATLDSLTTEYGKFFDYLKNNSEILKIGEKSLGNIDYSFKQDQKGIDDYGNPKKPNNNSSQTYEQDLAKMSKEDARKEYLENKRIAESLGKGDYFNALYERNERLRNFFKFKNGSYNELKDLKEFNTGGYTADSEGLAWLDKKELVLNEKQTADAFKIFNIADNIITKLKNFDITSIFKQKAESNQPSQSLQFEKLIHIDKVEKDADMNTILDTINNQFKRWGFRMG